MHFAERSRRVEKISQANRNFTRCHERGLHRRRNYWLRRYTKLCCKASRIAGIIFIT